MGTNTMRAPAVPCARSLLRSADTTTEGSRGVVFDPTTLFYWTTLIGAVLPPHAEPPPVIDHDREGVPEQSEQSESFELVSPPSINAVNGGGGNDHIGAHAWWTDLLDLTRSSQRDLH